MKNYKSYGFWTALAGAIVMLLNSIGKVCGFAVEEKIVTDIIMAIAGVLVVFGIVSMPKKKDEKDSIEEKLPKLEETIEDEKINQSNAENDYKKQENTADEKSIND